MWSPFLTLKNAIQYCKNEISHNVSTFTWENAELIEKWVKTHSLDEIEIIAPTVGKYEKIIPYNKPNILSIINLAIIN